MLLKIAEVLEVSVAELLGGNISDNEEKNGLAEQLSRINEQLAIKTAAPALYGKLYLES